MIKICYVLACISSIAILLFEKIKVQKKNQKVSPNKKTYIDEIILERIDKKIKKNKLLKNYHDKLIKKIAITNCCSFELAENKLKKGILKIVYVAFFSFCILFSIFKIWYIALTLSASIVYLFFNYYTGKIDKKISQLEMEFPETVQKFADEYIINRNIRRSLMSISEKSSGSIKLVFERLVRNIHSSIDENTSINEMAKSLDFFYAYAFAEILKLSLSDVGNVTKEIGFLIELMQDDLEQQEKTKSDLHENKAMFMILNAITAIVLVTNFIINPYAKDIYTYTSTGAFMIMIWVLEFIGGLMFISLNEKI